MSHRTSRDSAIRGQREQRERRIATAIPRPKAQRVRELAEGVGFEPTVACATTVFKTVPLNRSGTPPARPLDARNVNDAKSGVFRDGRTKRLQDLQLPRDLERLHLAVHVELVVDTARMQLRRPPAHPEA